MCTTYSWKTVISITIIAVETVQYFLLQVLKRYPYYLTNKATRKLV